MVERKSVLLVEDNPDDRDLTLRAFERHNLRDAVEVAEDGEAALQYLHAPGPGGQLRPLPDVVLLDLKLPRLDGLEVLRRLRANERTRDLPVVILTSSLRIEDLENGYACGAN